MQSVIYDMELFLDHISPEYIQAQCVLEEQLYGLHKTECYKIHYDLMLSFATSLAEWQQIYNRNTSD